MIADAQGNQTIPSGPTGPRRQFSITAPLATVLAAGLALIGGIAGAFVQGYFDQARTITAEEKRISGELDLEKAKLQTSLILKALETEDETTAVKTLKFFANAGLIPAYEERVLELATKDSGSAVPVLRIPGELSCLSASLRFPRDARVTVRRDHRVQEEEKCVFLVDGVVAEADDTVELVKCTNVSASVYFPKQRYRSTVEEAESSCRITLRQNENVRVRAP